MELLGINLSEKEFDYYLCEQAKGKQLTVKNGKIVAEDYTPSEEQILNELRAQRRTDCFNIVNRGSLWYETLTEQQLDELNLWYKNWLDVTKTKIVPQKPEWLDI